MHFDAIAEDYDRLVPPAARLQREGPFLVAWCGTATSLLDLACGSGAHAAHLAGRLPDLQVTATDLSAAMIDVACRDHPHPRVVYRQGDLRQPPPGRFERIMVLGNSLNLLPDPGTVAQALQAMRLSCAPSGSLLLQCTNPQAEANRVPRSIHRQSDDAVLIKQTVPVGDRRFLSLASFRRDADGDWYSSGLQAVLLDLDVDTLREMLAVAGFTSMTSNGDLRGAPFIASDSPDVVVIAGA